MKRSQAIQLTLVTSVAAVFMGCDRRATRYCVEDSQKVADDDRCGPSDVGHGHHWYYMGGGAGAFANGTRLSGGSMAEPAGGYSTRGGTARGGIGGAGEAAGGAHGGAGVGE